MQIIIAFLDLLNLRCSERELRMELDSLKNKEILATIFPNKVTTFLLDNECFKISFFCRKNHNTVLS